jgi:hypothetical protein
MTSARAAGVFDAVSVGDVRVVQRGKRLRLAFEAHQPIGIGRERLGQDFQRDVAIELRIARAIHLTHAACAEAAGDFVQPDRRVTTAFSRALT